MQQIQDIITLIDRAIKEEPEILLTTGNIIADGYDKQVDEYRDIITNSQNWLTDYQNKLIKEIGISTLRVKYNGIFGFFIEVSKGQIQKIPDYFTPKQTLVNVTRYTTRELDEFQEKFLEAEEKKNILEYEIFGKIREEILDNFAPIKNFSSFAANVDFLSSLAQVAYENAYTKPEITPNYDLKILGGKHPVVMKSTIDFISNNLEM
ncbi:MAG: hypothetical protein LBF15_05555 [Candidatus Peribacteria bacterium]|jgi:DNA mismatch repair protein MutS|nr:hypothetical protein [Candidatus Peribacteria bacterium]